MKHRYLLQKVREFSKIGLRYGVDTDEVESRAMEQLLGAEIDEDQNPDGFIYTTVKNAALQLYRKEKRRATPVPEFYDNMVGGVYDRSEFDGLVGRVRQHVESILQSIEDERRREAANAYYVHGLPTRHIAKMMELPKGTVYRLLYEARKQLEEDQLADVLAWDDFNRLETQHNNRNYGEGASEKLIGILRDEGFLL